MTEDEEFEDLERRLSHKPATPQNKKDEALKLALEALAASDDFLFNYHDCEPNEREVDAYSEVRANNMAAWEAVREALAEQPAQQQYASRAEQDLYEDEDEQPEQQPLTDTELINQGCRYQTELTQPAQQQEPVTVLPDGSAFAVMSYPLPKDHWLYADRQYNEGEYEPVELGKPVLTHELRNAVVSAVRYAIRGATNCGKEVDFDPDALVQNAVYALCGPFTSPPASKPWVGLTDEELIELDCSKRSYRAIEAKLREKNA